MRRGRLDKFLSEPVWIARLHHGTTAKMAPRFVYPAALPVRFRWGQTDLNPSLSHLELRRTLLPLEEDYYHVRPRKIQDTGDRWSHRLVSLNRRLFFTHFNRFGGYIFPERDARHRLVRRYLREGLLSRGVFFLREWNKTGRRRSY